MDISEVGVEDATAQRHHFTEHELSKYRDIKNKKTMKTRGQFNLIY